MKQNRMHIKIHKPKEEWINSFLDKVDDLNEDEDFLHINYPMPKGKDRIKLYKGCVDKNSGEIKLVYIYQQMRFMNKVIKFHGEFETINDELYITGEIRPLYVNYWNELFTVPGIGFLIPVLIIGAIIQQGFLKDIIFIFLILSMAFYMIPRIEAGDGKKEIRKWLNAI